jgi:tetratricopeptide (TPR) repeat protein
MTYHWLGETYLLKGEYEQIEILCKRAPAPHLTAGFLGYCYARTGRVDEARRLLRELESIPPCQPSPSLQAAVLHLGLGDPDAAIASLDRARRQSCFGVHWVAVDPLWDPLRAHPGFADILRRMNLG